MIVALAFVLGLFGILGVLYLIRSKPNP